jgi:hypothetical protein
MTDDELRKLAEAAIAGERFMVDDDGRRVSLREIMGEPPDPAPELARAVLRLLEERDDLARYKRLVADEFVKAGPFGHKTLAPFFGRVDRRYEAGE